MPTVGGTYDLGRGPFSHSQIASTISSRVQELIILPTEKCNFRCTYCYEDYLIGRMPERVQVAIERFLDTRVPELQELALSWFGGEPLVARRVVTRLASYANQLCKRYGVDLRGSLTTNGYLLNDELFDQLLSYEHRSFQITLDGWMGGHDAVRRMANGKGTFDQIWANLLAARSNKNPFRIQLRVHVRRDNIPSVVELVGNIAQEFGGDERFTIDFQHLRDLGGEGGKTVERPLSRAELATVEKDLREHYQSIVSLSGGPGDSVSRVTERSQDIGGTAEEGDGYICYAAKANSLLIRADGRLGKCTVALSDERNTIGKINDDGSVSVDNEALRPWLRGLWDPNPSVLHCPLQGMARQAVT